MDIQRLKKNILQIQIIKKKVVQPGINLKYYDRNTFKEYFPALIIKI